MDFKTAITDAKKSLGVKGAEIIARGLSIEKWDERKLKGCCPEHQDEKPSLSWDEKLNRFKCFGCGATIDIIDYYMDHGNINFIEATKELFNQTGTNYSFEDYEQYGNKKVLNKKEEPYKYPTEEKNDNRAKVEAYMKVRCIS